MVVIGRALDADKEGVDLTTITRGVFCAWIVLFSTSLFAQSVDEGKAAVSELLALAGAGKQYNQMLTVMTESMRAGFRQGFADAMKGRRLDEVTQEKAGRILSKHFQAMIVDMRTYMQINMPWNKLVEEVYTPLYLKHFTTAEIKEISAFYKSPTGRKFSQKGPQLIQESAQAVNVKYGAELNAYVMKQSAAHMEDALKEVKQMCATEKC